MASEFPNPYATPASVPHQRTPGSLLAMAVVTVCGVLMIGMLIVQQMTLNSLQGFDLPLLTRWLIHPAAALILVFGCAIGLSSRRWESKWWRTSVCLLVLLFAFLWASVFGLAMYLPVAAVRSALGI